MSAPISLTLDEPYLLFAGDETSVAHAKTGLGLAEWAPERCLGQCRLSADAVDFGLRDVSIAEARAAGAKSLIVGIAPDGGRLPPKWRESFRAALENGLDVVSGLHDKLNDDAELRQHAEHYNKRLIDIRTPPQNIPVGSGAKRSGQRVLTVGMDCSIGKKYMALALTKEMKTRGVDVDFRATGQTGIMIAGQGLPIDSVVSDFVAGAAELVSPDAATEHWDIIEGQGSLFHPSYAAVTMGLVHGSQPDAMVLCHEPTRKTIMEHPNHAIPPLEEAMDLYVRLAQRNAPNTHIAAIGLNTRALDENDALAVIAETQDRFGLPCADPLRTGVSAIVDALLENR
ncbi:MAG: DUF1611 domain-containing protein [Pseudomonadota bacterium]